VTACRAALSLTGSDRLDIEPISSRTVERVLTGILPGLTGISPVAHPVRPTTSAFPVLDKVGRQSLG